MQLSEHVITSVEGGLVRNFWPRLIGRNARLPIHGYGYENQIVILRTDTGLMGWGAGHADRTLQLLLTGRRLDEVFSPESGILDQACAAADLALHDLAGRALGVPVSKMICPDSPMRAKCYDGAIYMNDLSSNGDLGPEAVLRDCTADYAAGYRDFKVKVGRGLRWMDPEQGLRRDAAVVRAIRRAFPEAGILADANDGMDLQTAKRFMDMVQDCRLYWLEEPFPENSSDCAALRAFLNQVSPDTLLADGEFRSDPAQVMALAGAGVLDVLLMDPESFGFTAWRRLLGQCRALGFQGSPHCWGTKLKTNAVAHLAAAFPDVCPTIEGVPDRLEGVDDTGYAMADGWLSIPDRPGFGMELEYARPVSIFAPY